MEFPNISNERAYADCCDYYGLQFHPCVDAYFNGADGEKLPGDRHRVNL